MKRENAKFVIGLFCLWVWLVVACNPENEDQETKQEPTEELTQLQGLPKIDQLTAQIENDPVNAKLFFQRSQAYRAIHYIPHAIADLQQALSIDSTESLYFISLAGLFEEMNEINRAISTVEKALETDAKNPDLLVLSGKYNFYMQRYPAALADLNKALEKSLFNPKVYFLKGLIHKEVGDSVKSISAFQTAIEQNPEYYDGYIQLGLLYSGKKDNLAARYFQNAIKSDSSKTEAWYSLAYFYQQTGDFQQAKKTYEKLVVRDPQNERVHYNLGYIYFQQDSLKKADRKFEMATQVAPNYTDAYYMRGLVAEVRNDKANATYYYKQALNFDPAHELARQGMERIK